MFKQNHVHMPKEQQGEESVFAFLLEVFMTADKTNCVGKYLEFLHSLVRARGTFKTWFDFPEHICKTSIPTTNKKTPNGVKRDNPTLKPLPSHHLR